MKHTLRILTTLLLAPLATLHAAETIKPNIIVILADDMGPNNGVRPYPAASVTRIASFRRI